MNISQNLLFNFSASAGGGGLKRLEEYSKWFQAVGGSNFIISSSIYDSFLKKYPNNNYFSCNQNIFDRVFRDQSYIRGLPIDFKNLEFYYSYGIPIYSKIAKKNWFHISNVAPFKSKIEKSTKDILRNPLLKYRLLNNLELPDFISAESISSLKLLPQKYSNKFVCLPNGSDDEIKNHNKSYETSNYAVAVGTHPYKRIDRVIDCFKEIKKKYSLNRLYIFGETHSLNRELFNYEDIEFLGLKNRNEVIKKILSSKFYISCTTVENSFNAASEGIFLSERSLISNIGPHKELLKDEIKTDVIINGQEMFMVSKNKLTLKNIMSWDSVIKIMLSESGIRI